MELAEADRSPSVHRHSSYGRQERPFAEGKAEAGGLCNGLPSGF